MRGSSIVKLENVFLKIEYLIPEPPYAKATEGRQVRDDIVLLMKIPTTIYL